jgi:uncharacterized protein YgiM (DUF1202 family)
MPLPRAHLALCFSTLVAAALFLLPLQAQAQTRAETQTRPQAGSMVSAKKAVNMRAGAGTQHEVLWRLDPGYPLQVVGRRGSWLQVRDFENDQGWVYKPLTGSQRHHVVKAEIANVRSGPGTQTRVIGKATYGEVLRTLERQRDWVKVQQKEGRTGWVARRLLWGW